MIRTAYCCKLKCHSQHNAFANSKKHFNVYFLSTQLEIKILRALSLVYKCHYMRVCKHSYVSSRFVRILEKFITKSIECFFRVNIASSKHSWGLGELSKLFPTRAASRVCITVSDIPDCTYDPFKTTNKENLADVQLS